MKNTKKSNNEEKIISKHLYTLSKEYFSLTDEELIKKINNCMKTVNEEWENKKDILSFYEESKEYLFGLIPFNSMNRIEKVIFPVKYHAGCNILDFGAGIGETGMCFSEHNNVYYYDISKESQKFAKFVSEKTDRKLTFLKEEEVFTKKYDIIFLMDILEHLENPIEITEKLGECLNPNGILITSGLMFKVSDDFPMHLKENRKYEDEFNAYLSRYFSMIYAMASADEITTGWRKRK